MKDDYQSGFQKGETEDWAAAYSVFPQPVQMKDVLGAAGELSDWRDAPCAHKVEILGLLGKKRMTRSKLLARVTKLTGIEFVEIDTGSDLNLIIVLGKNMVKRHHLNLQSFANQLAPSAHPHFPVHILPEIWRNVDAKHARNQQFTHIWSAGLDGLALGTACTFHILAGSWT